MVCSWQQRARKNTEVLPNLDFNGMCNTEREIEGKQCPEGSREFPFREDI